MSEKDDRAKLIKGETDALLGSQFTTELGNKARVERTSIQNAYMDELRSVVSDVGRDLLKIGAVPKGMNYCGSLSVHIYKSEILKTAAFATVSHLDGVTFDLADGALRELTGGTMEQYGKARQKLRSGF